MGNPLDTSVDSCNSEFFLSRLLLFKFDHGGSLFCVPCDHFLVYHEIEDQGKRTASITFTPKDNYVVYFGAPADGKNSDRMIKFEQR